MIFCYFLLCKQPRQNCSLSKYKYSFHHACMYISSSSSWSSSIVKIALSFLNIHRTVCPYRPSLQAPHLDCIWCLHRADVCNSWLIGQHWRLHEKYCIGERHCWVLPYFSCSQHACFVWFGWFFKIGGK